MFKFILQEIIYNLTPTDCWLFPLTGLVKDSVYMVRVRAKSATGYGPWSHYFVGRTLKEGEETIDLITLNRNFLLHI